MPPTVAARCTIISGACSASARSMAPGSRRSHSLRRRAVTRAPVSRRRSTTWLPRNPLPPVTNTRRPLQKVLVEAIEENVECEIKASSMYGRWRIGGRARHVRVLTTSARRCDVSNRLGLLAPRRTQDALEQGAAQARLVQVLERAARPRAQRLANGGRVCPRTYDGGQALAS